MGTLNLCLKMPEKMQKTKNESDHPGLRKRPKTKKNEIFDFAQFSTVFGCFLSPERSDQFFVFCIVSGVTRSMFTGLTKGTMEDFFSTYKEVWPIFGLQANKILNKTICPSQSVLEL